MGNNIGEIKKVSRSRGALKNLPREQLRTIISGIGETLSNLERSLRNIEEDLVELHRRNLGNFKAKNELETALWAISE